MVILPSCRSPVPPRQIVHLHANRLTPKETLNAGRQGFTRSSAYCLHFPPAQAVTEEKFDGSPWLSLQSPRVKSVTSDHQTKCCQLLMRTISLVADLERALDEIWTTALCKDSQTTLFKQSQHAKNCEVSQAAQRHFMWDTQSHDRTPWQTDRDRLLLASGATPEKGWWYIKWLV